MEKTPHPFAELMRTLGGVPGRKSIACPACGVAEAACTVTPQPPHGVWYTFTCEECSLLETTVVAHPAAVGD